ncbi:MAG: TVP38/TMEM64 family protein [Spirochaetaceae bacterium]|nr:MAG: TVP38/TMEM64 family protein [Spirochaetaceae bacterium]
MNRKRGVRLLVLLVLLGTAVFLSLRFDLPVLLRALMSWIEARGTAGALVFVAVYIVATVLFIPGSILTLGAGAVYGVVMGTVWVSIASTLGAFAAFLTGRYIARDWVAAKTARYPRFHAIDQAVRREGWKIVFLTRNSPVFPFNLSNYAYGLTAVPAGGYLLASWIGMLPGTVMYVYLGSLAASVATLGASPGEAAGRPEPLQWALYTLGFIATVAVTILVTRTAKKALNQSLEVQS